MSKTRVAMGFGVVLAASLPALASYGNRRFPHEGHVDTDSVAKQGATIAPLIPREVPA